jgi:hypothetical protein
MKLRYIVGVLVGGAIGVVLSYLYSQGDSAAITSNLGIGALIGGLAGLYIVSAASASSKGSVNDGGAVGPKFG